MEMWEEQRIYATFFVEDLLDYVLNKNITKWQFSRSEYFKTLHKFMPQCYRFEEKSARAIVLALENYRDMILIEVEAVWNAVKNANELERPSKLCTSVENLWLKFVSGYGNFILFIAIVIRVCIRCCDEGLESLMSAAVYVTANTLTWISPGDQYGMFQYIKDSVSYFIESMINNVNYIEA